MLLVIGFVNALPLLSNFVVDAATGAHTVTLPPEIAPASTGELTVTLTGTPLAEHKPLVNTVLNQVSCDNDCLVNVRTPLVVAVEVNANSSFHVPRPVTEL